MKNKVAAKARKAKSTAKPVAQALAKADAGPRVLYVLSDSTGNLARHMLTAMLTQFPADALEIRFEPFIRSEARLDEVLASVRGRPGPVCHAVVSASFKGKITGFCREAGLAHHDLTQGLMSFLTEAAGVAPRGDVKSLHKIDESYKRRIGALEFTLSHDDGLGLATIGEADIVLAGVSRTGKTPTSIYLAQLGYRVANVALAMQVSPPEELLRLPAKKVVGLVISPQQLAMIRARRESDWRMSQTSYGEPANVAREITWARQLFNRQGWAVLDVTDQAIEETAAKIVHVTGASHAPPTAAGFAELP
jgi:regulator of PEP synthase PpsR (kinase-PPPase family)